MVNRVVLVGRLVKDPELKTTSKGTSVASFTIALPNKAKEQDGTRITMFINCTTFREQAENLVKYARKGMLVGVDGSISQKNYTRADGSKNKDFEIIVDNVTFLERNNAEPKEEPQIAVPNNSLDTPELPDEDLPF